MPSSSIPESGVVLRVIMEHEQLIGEQSVHYNLIKCQNETTDNDDVLYYTIHFDNDQHKDSMPMNLANAANLSEDLNSEISIIRLEDGKLIVTTAPEADTLDYSEPHLLYEDQILVNTDEIEFKDIMKKEPVTIKSENADSKYVFHIVNDTQNPSDVVTVYNNGIVSEDGNLNKKLKKEIPKTRECSETTSSSSSCTEQEQTHNQTTSKPYKCMICNRNFVTNYTLKSHIRTHTGEKPYICNVCLKPFRISGDLHKHKRIHTGDKPFVCPISNCGKAFTTSNIRKVHIRSHTGERPYECDYPNCGKKFSSSTNFKNHMRIHSGEKPYVCNEEGCEKRFTEYSSLYKHSMVHQTVKPFECSYCTQRFKTENSLQLHHRLKHNFNIVHENIILVNIP